MRVASAETEAHWIELCADHTYAQIEKLVALTPYGGLPGECKVERTCSQLTELRCTLEAEAMVIVERGLQSMCQEAGKVLSLAEAVEYLFAEFLAKRPLDEVAREKARNQARLDLEAEQQRDQALLEKCPARDILEWADTVEAEPEPCPGNAEVELVKRNPRLPGPKLRKRLLRRDGYCCATPGCPNTLFLQTHHIVFYCQDGLTVPWNLVVLCSRCHRNVHTGHLKVEGRAPEQLRFLDSRGRDLALQHRLDTAHWIDIWLGWTGGEYDTHYQRTRTAA